ncbi:MAG: thiamine-monophosphate kinase [Candidatus Fermentibacteraceae bacterium]|nr:thiamine-monophosphate kinase [Candidatus Fermentibacteraceae bacterium]
MTGSTVSDIGERGLIRRLRDTFPSLSHVGDDSSVLPALQCPVVTTDSYFEGSHFYRWWAPPEILGRRLLEATLSDIAAMGATPRWIFTAVTLLPDLDIDWIERFYGGLVERDDCVIAGGETIRGDNFGITLTAIGEGGNSGTLLRRSTLRPGDNLWLSGSIGRALDAPAILEKTGGLEGENLTPCAGELSVDRLEQIRAFLCPRAELELAAELRRKSVICGIDISDGLFSEAWHLSCESRIDIVLDIDESIFYNSVKDRPLEAASAGEDFVLLFSAPEQSEFASAGCRKIGYAKEGAGSVSVLINGRSVNVETTGYDHLEV